MIHAQLYTKHTTSSVHNARNYVPGEHGPNTPKLQCYRAQPAPVALVCTNSEYIHHIHTETTINRPCRLRIYQHLDHIKHHWACTPSLVDLSCGFHGSEPTATHCVL